MLIYAFIYLFYFINENVEEPLGCAVLFYFIFFWNLIRMKTLQFKNLFGRFFFFFLLRWYSIYCNWNWLRY